MRPLKKRVDFRRVARRADIDPAHFYGEELPGLSTGSGEFAWACCPFHDDHHPSFCVNLESGWFRCFSSDCGENGPSIVSFVSALHEMDYAEARQYLETHYG